MKAFFTVQNFDLDLSRRSLLKSTGLLVGGGCAFASSPLWASPLIGQETERKLNLYNIHTGESFKDTFWAPDQGYNPEAIIEINQFMRDWRCNSVTDICPQLLDLMSNIYEKVGGKNPIQIICGYRTPKTNRRLHGASRSKHLTGHAVDFNVPGVRLSHLRKAALSFKAGGVGYYPKSHFVHVDIRDRPAYW